MLSSLYLSTGEAVTCHNAEEINTNTNVWSSGNFCVKFYHIEWLEVDIGVCENDSARLANKWGHSGACGAKRMQLDMVLSQVGPGV